MQTSTKERRAVLRQAVALTVVVTAAIGGGAWLTARPANGDELRIPIQGLHSNAAELVQLCTERDAGQLSGRFFAFHLRQLATSQRSHYHELSRMRVAAGYAGTKREATDEGLALTRAMSLLRAGTNVEPAELLRIRDRLDLLQRVLKH